jgi:formate hydrogenlyase subunit 6/NADH:ubiquinone oxidoreductase subunit I
MGADCQNCSNVPPEVSIRHHNRYLHSQDEEAESYAKERRLVKKEGEINQEEVIRSGHMHNSAMAFSKFYRFEVENLPQRSQVDTGQEYEYETVRFQDGSIYDG